MKQQTRTLCEAALMLAMAQILSYIKISPLANGGSIDLAMLPLILFCVRFGPGWGSAVGFVFGLLQYFLGSGIAIDWTTMLADYIIAYTLMGLGAGLFRRKKNGVYWGSLLGGGLRFLASFVVGATVWAKYMPTEFLGLPMVNEWGYSFLYNICWAGPDVVLLLVLFALLKKPLHRYITAADLPHAE